MEYNTRCSKVTNVELVLRSVQELLQARVGEEW